MALNKAAFKTSLKSALKSQLDELFTYGVDNYSGDNKTAILNSGYANAERWSESLSDVISNQVDTYIKTATVTVPSGIPVTTAGTAAAQTGTTTAPGIGTVS